MKRNYTFIFMLVLIFGIIFAGHNSYAISVSLLEIDLGFNRDSLNNQNLYLKFNTCMSDKKFKLLYDSELMKSRSYETSNIYFSNSIQAEYLLKKLFMFVSSEYKRSSIMGIDETDIGIGVGKEAKRYKYQLGLFSRSKLATDEIFIKTTGHINYPIGKLILLSESLDYEINLNHKDDFMITSDSYVALIADEHLKFKVGLKYSFDHLTEGESKDFRWWYANVSINF